jgi:hypothetical protein
MENKIFFTEHRIDPEPKKTHGKRGKVTLFLVLRISWALARLHILNY